jgi:hypothetical protein
MSSRKLLHIFIEFVRGTPLIPAVLGINVRRDVAPRGRPEYCSVHVGVAQQKKAWKALQLLPYSFFRL